MASHLSGITAGIVATDWILANYDGTKPGGGADDATRIRNFLMDAYQTWGTEYALLGGNKDIVPARNFEDGGVSSGTVDNHSSSAGCFIAAAAHQRPIKRASNPPYRFDCRQLIVLILLLIAVAVGRKFSQQLTKY